MSNGITSGLNVMLERMNLIERNFAMLEGINDFNQNNKAQDVGQASESNDFQDILENKINEKNEEEQTDKPLKKTDEEAKKEILTKEENIQKVQKAENKKLEILPKINMNIKKTDIDKIIETFSDKYDVDGDFIKAIIKQESGFNPKATSKKGAMGLMQLMPQTAKSLGVNNAYNPGENIEGGVKHIKKLLSKYNNNEKLALAAYNAGEGAVKRYGGIPPYKETQNYVNSIMASYNKMKEGKA